MGLWGTFQSQTPARAEASLRINLQRSLHFRTVMVPHAVPPSPEGDGFSRPRCRGTQHSAESDVSGADYTTDEWLSSHEEGGEEKSLGDCSYFMYFSCVYTCM